MGHAPSGGMAGSLGSMLPALEVGAPAALGEPPVRVLGPQRGLPGFGDQDVPAGTCE